MIHAPTSRNDARSGPSQPRSGGHARATSLDQPLIRAGATIGAACRSGAGFLASAGCAAPQTDAEQLLADSLGIDRETLLAELDLALPAGVAEAASTLIARRGRREPLEYIRRRCTFRGLEMVVDSRVMIPEVSSQLALKAGLKIRVGARVHEVGTGCGAIALAMKHERPDLVVSGSDLSAIAVEVARTNARRLGLDVAFTVARDLPPGEYDLIVANLPYDSQADFERLPPEVTHYSPCIAHVAGQDGLDTIRAFIAGVPAGTRVALHHSLRQADAVRRLVTEAQTYHDQVSGHSLTSGQVK